VASPPTELDGFGVQTPQAASGALHTGPYPPDLSTGFAIAGLRTPVHSHLHLLTLLDEPTPSGSPGTSRLCRGRLPPSPPFPGSGCPQLHQAAATTRRGWSLTTPRHTRRLVAHSSAAKKEPTRSSGSPGAARRSPAPTPGSGTAPHSRAPAGRRCRSDLLDPAAQRVRLIPNCSPTRVHAAVTDTTPAPGRPGRGPTARTGPASHSDTSSVLA